MILLLIILTIFYFWETLKSYKTWEKLFPDRTLKLKERFVMNAFMKNPN